MITEIDKYVLYADIDLTYGLDKWSRKVEFEIKNVESLQFQLVGLIIYYTLIPFLFQIFFL